jgi:N6-adenosine-specific RNA methylase IME4
MDALIKYDAACRAIAAAKTVIEVKQISNAAAAWRTYARQAKNRALEVDCAEIRMRAERRVGELMSAQKAAVGFHVGGRPRKTTSGSDVVLPTLKKAGIDDRLADRARKFAAIPLPKFEALILEWRDRILAEHERVTTNLLREGARRLRHDPPDLPVGVYRLLYADPPWEYEHVITESRAIENQYPTMTIDAIRALEPPAADDAVLFLWATSPKLADALTVLDAWGFTYRTCAVWDKVIIGMGYYFRQQHELLLVGARGALPVPEPAVRCSSVIQARRGRHSEKPAVVYGMLESMYPTFTELDRVELFQRVPRPGWSGWGNEPVTEAAS